MRQLALDQVWFHDPRRKRLLAFLLVLDLDEALATDSLAQRADELLLGARRPRLGGLGEVEFPERLLELAADALERRVCIGGDHRADVLEREPDRARLERRQPRREAERVAPELLVDVHGPVAQLRVHGVAAASEVDEVEERQVLLELLRGHGGEAFEQLRSGDQRLLVVAAGGEQVGE